jgi:hypothetical protein
MTGIRFSLLMAAIENGIFAAFSFFARAALTAYPWDNDQWER